MKSFDKTSYTSLLSFAKNQGYSISPVRNVKMLTHKKFIMLRHDVDLDLDSALQMADLEAKMGIHSTYFVLLFNNFYNPLSPENKKKIVSIKQCGHEIGIHWDERDYKGDIKNFKRNKSMLEDVVGEEIISASQHEPVETSRMNLGRYIKYETYRDFKDLIYISDSSMKWRKITPWEVLEQGKNMHLLIHPFWWMTHGTTLDEKFEYFKKKKSKEIHALISRYKKDTKEFLKHRDELDKKYMKSVNSSL